MTRYERLAAANNLLRMIASVGAFYGRHQKRVWELALPPGKNGIILKDGETWHNVVVSYQGSWDTMGYTGPRRMIMFLKRLAGWVMSSASMEQEWFVGWPGYDQESMAKVNETAMGNGILIGANG